MAFSLSLLSITRSLSSGVSQLASLSLFVYASWELTNKCYCCASFRWNCKVVRQMYKNKQRRGNELDITTVQQSIVDFGYAVFAYMYKCANLEYLFKTDLDIVSSGMSIGDNCTFVPDDRKTGLRRRASHIRIDVLRLVSVASMVSISSDVWCVRDRIKEFHQKGWLS